MINKVDEFKNRFNQALSIRNMKAVELAEKTGLSESTISQYRSGYAKPKEKKLAIIANALDVSPTWLMGLDVPMELEKTPQGYAEYVTQLYNESKKENAEEQEEIQEIINLLVELPRSERKFLHDFLITRGKQT